MKAIRKFWAAYSHVFVSPVLVMAAGWTFYSQWIAPLRQNEQQAAEQIKQLSVSSAQARRSVKDVQELEAELGRARIKYHQTYGDLPTGSAMVWFPARLKLHFSQRGFNSCTTFFNTSLDAERLPGYEYVYWAVNVPLNDVPSALPGVLSAIAEIEQTNPLVRVLKVTLQPDMGNPQQHIIVLNVGGLVRKERMASF